MSSVRDGKDRFLTRRLKEGGPAGEPPGKNGHRFPPGFWPGLRDPKSWRRLRRHRPRISIRAWLTALFLLVNTLA